MSILALVHPSDLLGKELRQALDQRRDLWREIRLLSDDEDETGTLTEVAGAAALVERLDDGDLESVDCAIFCGPLASSRALLPRLATATTAIVLAPDAEPADGTAIVAGINLEHAVPGGVLLSPHPGAVGLAHLLAPLAPLAPRQAIATLLEPVSLTGGAALDEVLEQTRGILAFQSGWPKRVFGTQIAFNMLPSARSSGHLGALVEGLLGEQAPSLSVQSLQTGIFHGCSLSVHLTFEHDPGLEAIRERLRSHASLELVDDPGTLGPIRAAARDKVLVGRVTRAGGTPAAYWIWAVFDNLTVGGAQNTLAILEAISAQSVH